MFEINCINIKSVISDKSRLLMNTILKWIDEKVIFELDSLEENYRVMREKLGIKTDTKEKLLELRDYILTVNSLKEINNVKLTCV